MAVYSPGQMFIICKTTTPRRRIAATGPNQGAAITCNIQTVKKAAQVVATVDWQIL